MAGDLFGGVFDNLRGYSDSIEGFFSRGQSTSPRTIGAQEEADLISSGWQSKPKKSLFSSAAADVSKTLVATYGSSSGADAREFSPYNQAESLSPTARTGNTSATASVDPGDFERTWIARLSQFAKIQDITGTPATAKAPKASKESI